MSTTRMLFDLQELDHRLFETNGRVSDIDDRLGRREALTLREEEIVESKSYLQGLKTQGRNLELTAETVKEKKVVIESKLYGGSVGNPRELQDLSNELTNIKGNIKDLDEEILNLMMDLEHTETELLEREGNLVKEEKMWNEDQNQMSRDKRDLEINLKSLEGQREEITRRLKIEELQVYERVRRNKGGYAVTIVERGLCRTCGVTLPTHKLQLAKSGRESILCSNCGLILFVG